jgi:hypothetical protein
VVLKWQLTKGQNPKHQIHRLRDLSVFVLNISIICWSFPFMFAVKHSSVPSTKLTLVLLAKYRSCDVEMERAMRMMVSVY